MIPTTYPTAFTQHFSRATTFDRHLHRWNPAGGKVGQQEHFGWKDTKLEPKPTELIQRYILTLFFKNS